MLMFWVYKLSFVVDILAFFGLETFFGYFLKIGQFFFKSSDHPVGVSTSKPEVFPDGWNLEQFTVL